MKTIDEYLAELKRLDDAAPPAPWALQVFGSGSVVVDISNAEFGKGRLRANVNAYDAATRIERTDDELQQDRFRAGQIIRDSRNALPVLVKMVEYLLAELDAYGINGNELHSNLQTILDESEGGDR